MPILTELVREGFIDGDADGFKDICWDESGIENVKMRLWLVSNDLLLH